MTDKRIDWVDHTKGIGIFLVVVGHVLGGLRDASILHDSAWDEFVRLLYAFHMPLFFFIAGLFVQRSAKRRLAEFFLNKLSVIAYPYFVWSLLQGALELLAARYVNHPISPFALLTITYNPIKQYWFLYTLFVILVLYKLVYDSTGHRGKMAANIILLLAIVCYAVEAFGLEVLDWSVLHSVCSFLIYFALGAVIAEVSTPDRLGHLRTMRAVGTAVIGYALVAAAIEAHLDGKPLFAPELAILGTVATIAVATMTSRLKHLAFVRTWGLLSLEIFVAHTIAAAFVRIFLQKALGVSAPLPHILLGTGAGLYVPILLAYIAQGLGLPLFALKRFKGTPAERKL